MPSRPRPGALPPRPLLAVTVACVAVAALTACSEGAATPLDTSPSAPAATSAPATTPSAAAPATTPVPAAGPAEPSSAAAEPSSAAAEPSSAAVSPTPAATTGGAGAPVLVLESDGLGVAVGASIRQLPFGTARTTLATALAVTLGGGLRATAQGECGQGPRAQLDRQGFSALFDGAKFVGWTDSGHLGRHLTTGDGLGVGSTLAQLRRAHPDLRVTTASLGPEFTSPGLSGLLDGTGATGRVTTIYAGETCFFR